MMKSNVGVVLLKSEMKN